jgi:hypothetical protein
MGETANVTGRIGAGDAEPNGGRGDDDVERILEAHDLAARQLEHVLSAIALAEGSLQMEEERRVDEGAAAEQLEPLRSARLALGDAQRRLSPVVAVAESRRERYEREWFEVVED